MLVPAAITLFVVFASAYVVWKDPGSLLESLAIIAIVTAVVGTGFWLAWWAPFAIYGAYFVIMALAVWCWQSISSRMRTSRTH